MRQQVLFILQQDDPLAPGTKRQVLVLPGMHDACGPFYINMGILEQAQAELHFQDSAQRPAHERHRHLSFFHSLDPRAHVGATS
jgi:hypothetical protein